MAMKKEESSEIVIHTVETETLHFCVLGKTPLICNRMSQKVWQELLAPKGKKTSSEKASSLKHNPLKEFRDSPYRMDDRKSAALLAILPTAFKGAMGTAALDAEGVKKAQIGRLVSVDWDKQPVFGIPKVFMAITRSADINHTPDVRTRAMLPEWACSLSITYTKPMLRKQSITNLLAAAGTGCGVGDWRQGKGSGGYGKFELVSADNADWKRIVATQGRKAQQEALDNPVAYDDETSEMLAWFDVEITRRGFKVDATPDVAPIARRHNGSGKVDHILGRVGDQ